jgi:hypothetical protein
MRRIATALLLSSFLSVLPVMAQEMIEVQAAKDNTLFEDTSGGFSNGSGQHFFAGKTSVSKVRRGLVAFDVSTVIPPGATIDSVQVQLQMNKSRGGTHRVRLYRVTRDWGEGSSDAAGEEGQGTAASTSDATWLNTMHPGTPWINAGGDFQSLESASADISSVGPVVWFSTSSLVDDVNHWRTNPAESFGWIVRGDEITDGSALRFSSRENPIASENPVLRVYYTTISTLVESSEQPNSFDISARYPNPFSETITIAVESDRGERVNVSVSDLHGRVVHRSARQVRQGRSELELDGTAWAAGLYVVSITGKQGTRSTQVIRMR